MDDIGRLTALAERCAAEGQMNLNKYLEAVIYAKTRHAGYEYHPMVSAERILPELEASLQVMKQAGQPSELIDAVELGYRMLSEGRHGDMLADEAPDVFVCRKCGFTALTAPPDRCPECHSWPGQFRKFVAIFNGDNFDPTNPMEVLTLQDHNAKDLQALVAGLSEEDMNINSKPGEWTIGEHIVHFYDSQVMLDKRIELMLNNENPELSALALYEFPTQAERHPTSGQAVLQEFIQLRDRCLDKLAALPLKALWRTGRHTEFGQITILRQAAYIAYHEQTHLPDVEELRKLVNDRGRMQFQS